MMQPTSEDLLPARVPACPNRLLLLRAIRCMAAGGLHDARATMLMMNAFGTGFRRPLIMLRAFMGECARVAARRVMVAPACCARMTIHESALLDTVAAAGDAPRDAHEALTGLLGVRHCLGALSSAQALHQAFADHGLAIGWD